MKREPSSSPVGWAVVAIDEVCEIVAGNPAPQDDVYFENGTFNFVRVQDMGQMGDKSVLRIAKDKINERATARLRLFRKGSVLFTKSGASTLNNQRAILGEDSYVVSHIGVANPRSGISSEWIYYALKQIDFKKLAHSSVMPSLPLSKVTPLLISVPPTKEQHRIVVKIEELFSELDKGIENLKTAQAQLKVYRQALLKHAFEGKLTAPWREANRDKLETADGLRKRIQQERAARYQQQLADWESGGKQGSKPKAPKELAPLTAEELAELPELPKGWGWARLIEACDEVVDCHNKTAPYQATGIPLVRTPSIRDMKLNFDDAIRYVSRETYDYWSRRCPPLPGDILFTREAPMGEAALIPDGKMVCMGQRIMLFRPSKFLSGRYLLSATQNPIFKRVANKVAVGTGVKHLRVGDVEKLVFSLCSVIEQTEIANQLDSCLSEADQLEQTITTALQQSEALRQSILKKAFSGQLVPQDPNDEPAAALLARIKAERAAPSQKSALAARRKRSAST